MSNPRELTYAIKHGDNLYHLARFYQTSVASLLAANPGIDPYNLQVGAPLRIIPGEDFAPDGSSLRRAAANPGAHMSLNNDMRLAWEQHVYWTRMLLISIASRLGDQGAVTARLLRNPGDIAEIFSAYYPAALTDNIARLLTEHLKIGAALITALRDGRSAEAGSLSRKWYLNADQMADVFSGLSPYYRREELRDMLRGHLDLTTQEVSARLSRNYRADIDAFELAEAEALEMADYFTSGLVRQFPQRFE